MKTDDIDRQILIKFLQNVLVVLSSIIKLQFSISDILNIAFNHSRVMNQAMTPAHFGPLAISTSIKGSAKSGFAILSLCRKTLEHINDSGISSCWAIADKKNLESQNLLIALGFKFKKEIPLFGRTDYLYILKFQ